MQVPIADWGQALMTSLAAALALFLSAIPRIIGFLAILIIGWLIASAVAAAFAGLLRTVRFNDLARRSGFSDFVDRMGVSTDASGVIAEITKWFIRLIVLVVAFDALGLPAVSAVLQELLLWLPNLVVALVILVVGGLAANGLYRLVRASTEQAGFSNPELIGNVARVAVLGFAIIVAVNQLGIATTLVNTLFFGIVAALAIAFGLAFGLGGRETAAEVVRDWYSSGKEASAKMEKAGRAAEGEAHRRTETERGAGEMEARRKDDRAA